MTKTEYYIFMYADGLIYFYDHISEDGLIVWCRDINDTNGYFKKKEVAERKLRELFTIISDVNNIEYDGSMINIARGGRSKIQTMEVDTKIIN